MSALGDKILKAYLAEEARQKATPQGQDCMAIVEQIAGEFSVPVAEVRALVMDNIFMGPN